MAKALAKATRARLISFSRVEQERGKIQQNSNSSQRLEEEYGRAGRSVAVRMGEHIPRKPPNPKTPVATAGGRKEELRQGEKTIKFRAKIGEDAQQKEKKPCFPTFWGAQT